jgi:hypothetical protein
MTFHYTDLSGPIPCSLVDRKKQLTYLDVSDTLAAGPLPGCILSVR